MDESCSVGPNLDQRLLDTIAGVFVFDLPGLVIFRGSKFCCSGDFQVGKGPAERGCRNQRHWVNKGESLRRCLAHCLWTGPHGPGFLFLLPLVLLSRVFCWGYLHTRSLHLRFAVISSISWVVGYWVSANSVYNTCCYYLL